MIQEKIRRFIITLFVFVLSIVLVGCNKFDDEIFKVADDEIALQIKLDTEEDIGLLIVNYDANGTSGSGGTSNADKSLLKHGETLMYTLNKQELDNLSDGEDISIQFIVITEYVDPNYDNIYPEEYTKVIETPVSLKVHYGESYLITISGNKINGYEAYLVK